MQKNVFLRVFTHFFICVSTRRTRTLTSGNIAKRSTTKPLRTSKWMWSRPSKEMLHYGKSQKLWESKEPTRESWSTGKKSTDLLSHVDVKSTRKSPTTSNECEAIAESQFLYRSFFDRLLHFCIKFIGFVKRGNRNRSTHKLEFLLQFREGEK